MCRTSWMISLWLCASAIFVWISLGVITRACELLQQLIVLAFQTSLFLLRSALASAFAFVYTRLRALLARAQRSARQLRLAAVDAISNLPGVMFVFCKRLSWAAASSVAAAVGMGPAEEFVYLRPSGARRRVSAGRSPVTAARSTASAARTAKLSTTSSASLKHAIKPATASSMAHKVGQSSDSKQTTPPPSVKVSTPAQVDEAAIDCARAQLFSSLLAAPKYVSPWERRTASDSSTAPSLQADTSSTELSSDEEPTTPSPSPSRAELGLPPVKSTKPASPFSALVELAAQLAASKMVASSSIVERKVRFAHSVDVKLYYLSDAERLAKQENPAEQARRGAEWTRHLAEARKKDAAAKEAASKAAQEALRVQREEARRQREGVQAKTAEEEESDEAGDAFGAVPVQAVRIRRAMQHGRQGLGLGLGMPRGLAAAGGRSRFALGAWRPVCGVC